MHGDRSFVRATSAHDALSGGTVPLDHVGIDPRVAHRELMPHRAPKTARGDRNRPRRGSSSEAKPASARIRASIPTKWRCNFEDEHFVRIFGMESIGTN